MSYNFAFWAGGDELDPLSVYKQFGNGEHVAGIASLSRERVLAAIADHLAGWPWDGQILQPPGTNPDGVPAFDVSIGEQNVEFVGYGWEPEHANAIIDAMHALGLRLYDPQVDERFA
ncbi:hypothetical protein [Williamsia sp.]|uniref:hypothetical protein n=1 Tax=Williamsia sp. TaxID=1872085 RepID=UPI001A358999|nr:hypothetical protein [Williamsia sp.]MBJ7291657.1 hypothetical protein [Williamsia sp.]